jgi:hypothetical protein
MKETEESWTGIFEMTLKLRRMHRVLPSGEIVPDCTGSEKSEAFFRNVADKLELLANCLTKVEEENIRLGVEAAKLREANRELVGLLTEVRDACKAEPIMNNHKYDSLGIAVNKAIDKAALAKGER